jgi:hypothetical protein
MAFLDNSGDIILDAVLTDTGRKLLARGDGSFRVTKFALGDDEINYELFDATHASGSAYYDLNILQSPIMEAFTNNTSSMKSKLLTLSNNNLRFLPEIRLNQSRADSQIGSGSAGLTTGLVTGAGAAGQTYIALADQNTLKLFTTGTIRDNVSNGEFNGGVGGVLTTYQGTGDDRSIYSTNGNRPFCLDQGIVSTAEGTAALPIGNSLYETQYLVEVDNRFFSILSPDGRQAAPRSFVDDDNIASYFFAIQNAGVDIGEENNISDDYFGSIQRNDTGPINTPVIGRTGSRFRFRLRATEEVERGTGASNYLFTTFGENLTIAPAAGSQVVSVIETNIRVTGMTTGYRVSIPVQIAKANIVIS